jgi:hypothetical protein
MFIEGARITDIKTRVAHPESNGRLERLHCTYREEKLTEENLLAMQCSPKISIA